MILYWAWPTGGAGHATRAAAICRRLQSEVLVVRGTADPSINRALNRYSIPYVVHESRSNAVRWVAEHHQDSFLVFDDQPENPNEFGRAVDLYLRRMNRKRLAFGPQTAVIEVEGPAGLWPIVLLDDDEILSREDARSALSLDDSFVTIGVPSASSPGLVEATAPDFMLTPDRWWPALRWMRAADHLVGCIGANLFAEAAYLDLPATWLTDPNRPDQEVRIKSQASFRARPDAARTVAEEIDRLHG